MREKAQVESIAISGRRFLGTTANWMGETDDEFDPHPQPSPWAPVRFNLVGEVDTDRASRERGPFALRFLSNPLPTRTRSGEAVPSSNLTEAILPHETPTRVTLNL